jgi:Mce-associated membrane protein
VPTEADADLVAPIPAAGTAHDIRESVHSVPEDVVEPETEPEPAGPTVPSGPLLTRFSAILAVVCLLLAGGIAAVLLSARSDDLRTASNGQVTSSAYRSAAMSTAASSIARVLSYSYKTLPADEKAARALISSEYGAEYAEAMDKLGPKAVKAKLTLKATVMATSLVSLKEDQAKVLVFVNRVTTADGSKQQQLNQDRLLVTMKRDRGDWFVSKIDTF